MTVTPTYDAGLSRVRVSASGLSGSPVTALVERSIDGVTWSTVRGGTSVTVSGGSLTLPVDDYEFIDGLANTYRVTAYNVSDVQVDQETAAITPDLTGVWLKSIGRPFLNRQVTVADYSDIERPSRAGVFDVIGRSYPVAVSDVRGSRRWTLEVLTSTTAEATDLDLILASGDPLFVHVPADCTIPGGYVTVGDTTQRRTSRRGLRRMFVLPCVEIAAPGADVVGATSTWQTVVSTYATWSDVISAHTTWADLLELIGSPSDVIVP